MTEFYNAGLNQYFITPYADEAAMLDAAITIKGWARTGVSFSAYAKAHRRSHCVTGVPF